MFWDNLSVQLQGSRFSKERTQHDGSYLTQSSFWGTFSIIQLLEDARCVRSHLYFHFQAKKENLVEPLD
jgi:hypothetical protein